MTDASTKPPLKASVVFLDTEVFVEANFSFKSPRFLSMTDLARTGRIRVLLTDLTLREIAARMKGAIERASVPHPQPILRNSSLPQVKALFEGLDSKAIEQELMTQLEEFVKACRITVLPVRNEYLAPVLANYFAGEPPFGPGKNKAEFPDALALEAVKEWARAEGRDVAVISRDGGVRAACSATGPLYHYEGLAEYLNVVASEDAALAAFIREMIAEHDDEIFGRAMEAFPSLDIDLADEVGEIEDVDLTGIDYDGDVEIIALEADRAILETPATLTFSVKVSHFVDHGDEYPPDKVRARVTQRAQRRIVTEVAFKGLDPKSFEVRDVWFEGKKSISVRVHDGDWR